MTTVYLILAHRNDEISPACIADTPDEAKRISKEMVTSGYATDTIVEEWQIDGAWGEPLLVYVYPTPEPDIDELGADRPSIYP